MALVSEIFAAVALIIFIMWWINRKRKTSEFLKNFPSPPSLPILGHAWDVRKTTLILDSLLKHSKEHRGLVHIRVGPLRDWLVVSDYQFLEYVLSSTKILNKSAEYTHMKPWLGTGLLTSDGPKWKKHRKILTPAFHFQILEQFIEVFEATGNKFIEKLKNVAGNSSVDIYPLVTLCALDIICESAMGTSINAQDNIDSDYVKSVKNMCKIIMDRVTSPIEMHDWLFIFCKNFTAQTEALRILHNQTNSVINQRRKELLNKTQEDDVHEEFGIKRRKAFLDLLLNATVDGRPLTQEEIREEVDTFMFEGHDTTASAISFALFCLANHADVQNKVLQEQKEIFGDNSSPDITYTDLQNMKYLEQVIKETLRLYPSVPIYSRETFKEVEYDGKIIPPGVIMVIFPYGIHRNPKYFNDPETFNPSRFDDIDGKLPYAYIPFSAGPRNCIGQRFAMLEMKSILSKVIRNFVLRPAIPTHTPILSTEMVLKSANGIRIGVELRNRN